MAKSKRIFSLAKSAVGESAQEKEEVARFQSKTNVFLQDLSNSNHDNGELREIPLSSVDSFNNPRKNFSEDALSGLAQNIKAHGLLQPIIVRKSGKRFELIAGERRIRAVKLNGAETILAVVKDTDFYEPEIIPELKLTENLQREDLSDLESAFSLTEIKSRNNYSISELVNKFGKSESWIKQKLAHAKLAEDLLSKNIVPSVTMLDKLPTTHILQLKIHFDSHSEETAKWLIPKLKSGAIPSRKEIQEFGTNPNLTDNKKNDPVKSSATMDPKSRIASLKQKIKKDNELIATIQLRISKNQSLIDELQNKKKKK
ncbi:ParB/RepB/Spo0J family partition protein [Leptospira stimsonii]|uniref:ParB/RepB/Spo0J family partition protein n=1 Tax=Leptospira stimsonii TaxID=2202203 RepID=A0ABY2MXF0_9LEPT|nr:ParB/RepB/Spo0J family partition protein [Leptospira stimsonii]TGK10716.1 ParB/RepB/Spo0J family partition protein [Leptospira stimsonii]TGM11006.1 ParB/RepB/Spo0J family partition protein [Leptospira stimsonii]